MVNLNSNNTIIENVEYLDMDDPKNSWYFDAERFDVNFPLVRSYSGDASNLFERLFAAWYEYWDAVFAYYKNLPHMTGICYVVDTPDTDNDSTEYSDTNITFMGRIKGHFEYEFLFRTKQVLPNGKKITYFLVGVSHEGGLTDVGERFYLKGGRYYGNMFRDKLHPHTQLIISKDWDLLKRYFFFMIRNHQYEHSRFIYTVGEGVKEWQHPLADLDDTPFNDLPGDHRFGCKEYDDEGLSEPVNERVLVLSRDTRR